MRRYATSFVLLCTVTLTFSTASAAAAHPPRAGAALMHVMIRLQGPPLAADTNLKASDWSTHYRFKLDPYLPASVWYAKALERYQNQELAYLRQHGMSIEVRQRFHLLFDGFTATVRSDQLTRLRSLANVEMVSAVPRYRPLLDKSVPLINAPQAWSQFFGGGPQAGRGLFIADIDTGIDIKNPCFRDTGFILPPQFGGHTRADTAKDALLTNNKVIVARVFAGSNPGGHYTAADDFGHGTFTGAIETCDYNTPTPIGTHVSGVAPGAYLMVYKALFATQPATPPDYDPFLAALEAATLDGADVINFSGGVSLGSGEPQFDPDELAVEQATSAGIPVVISAGNAGPTPESISSPSADPSAISVGAVTNAGAVDSSLTIQGSSDLPAALARLAAREGSYYWSGTIGPAQLVDIGEGRLPGQDPNALQANDLAGKDLQGKIAVIEHGIIRSTTKLLNAFNAGAIGVVFYDEQDEPGLATIGESWGCPDTPDGTCQAKDPVLWINNRDGRALVDWLKAHPSTTATMDSARSVVSETPAVLSKFSSRGDAAGYLIKPDLVGPGQDIYSATEDTKKKGEMYDPSGFVTEDGTSFSAPHVTGAVALILAKHPKWTPAMVKANLMNTANTNVYLDVDKTKTPSVMDAGAGLIDVEAALSATAYVSPASVSFGQSNVAAGTVQRDVQVTAHDLGGGAGDWSASVTELNGANGFSVSVPASVTVPANGQIAFSLHMSASSATPAGNYDGYVYLKRGSVTLHVPYYAHVVSQPVKPGSILLVDNTTSKYVPTPGSAPLVHLDVTHYYENTLTRLGRSYTYWDEAKLGTPSLADMKQASAVIEYTGSNLNNWAPQNADTEALMPPLGPDDLVALHQYLDQGGRVLLTGVGAALPDGDLGYWTAIVMGANPTSTSVYDTSRNDRGETGGIAPPQPSAYPDAIPGTAGHAGIFAGLKPFDLSGKGDGAKDNVAVHNPVIDTLDPTGKQDLGLLGVAGMKPIRGYYRPFRIFGRSALRASVQSLADGGVDVGIVSSDEPTFQRAASYPGRAVMFSFGFEGINDNTGYATREQVMQRILQWFSDRPSASVTIHSASRGARTTLGAVVHASSGARAAAYQWQVGKQTLHATTKPTTYTFPHAGQYRIRVSITDSLGHMAVSPWSRVSVR